MILDGLYRTVGGSENPGVPVVIMKYGRHNLPLLVEIGLTDVPKALHSRGRQACFNYKYTINGSVLAKQRLIPDHWENLVYILPEHLHSTYQDSEETINCFRNLPTFSTPAVPKS